MFDSTLDTIEISQSVGRKGKNLQEDVLWVKMLLNRAMPDSLPQLPVDENCDGATIDAIENYQRSVMGLRASDGKVDPGGKTLKSLQKVDRDVTPLTWSVPRSSLGEVNRGLKAVDNKLMTKLFGMPRETFSQDDQPVTNPKLKKNITFADVGPFKVPGLRPAVESLRLVMDDIKSEQPKVYEILGTAGMLVCRYVRGSTTVISNHSWGTAIDLKLNKILDKRGDNRVQFGLTLIAPIFNRHDWYWGGSFNKEDAMHFEGSRSLVESWAKKLI
jgi:hypothetical protein